MTDLPTDRARLGRLAESMAADFLRRRGATVLARNFHTDDGELDLVVAFGREPAAVEVRSARRAEPGPDLVPYAKLQQVRRVAAGVDPPIFRIDVVTVLMARDGVRIRWHPRA